MSSRTIGIARRVRRQRRAVLAALAIWVGAGFGGAPHARAQPAGGYFKTPSGNIICFYDTGTAKFVQCGIRSGLKPAVHAYSCRVGEPSPRPDRPAGLRPADSPAVRRRSRPIPRLPGAPAHAGLRQALERRGHALHLGQARPHVPQPRRARVLPQSRSLAPLLNRRAAYPSGRLSPLGNTSLPRSRPSILRDDAAPALTPRTSISRLVSVGDSAPRA
jgi:hypothetical protein